MTQDTLYADVAETRIPEGRRVGGLEYGAHVSQEGWAGYYVRPQQSTRWLVARTTQASDELLASDRAIVRAIRDEIRSMTTMENAGVLDQVDED